MNNYHNYFKSVTSDHCELIYKWRNKPEIRKLMFNDEVIPWSTHITWFNSIKNDNKNIIKLFIEENEPRGIVQVNQINEIHQTAEWGFYLGDPYKKGLGTLMGYHALNYIFDELNIRKLSAKILSINEISIGFHQKMGFIQEGILQQQLIRNNQFIDIHLYTLFNHQWKQHRPKIVEGFYNE